MPYPKHPLDDEDEPRYLGAAALIILVLTCITGLGLLVWAVT